MTDDEGGDGVEPLGEGEFIGDSVEGTTGDDVGLLTGDLRSIGGDIVGADNGECMACGGLAGVAVGGGVILETGEFRGGFVGVAVGGGVAGEVGGGAEVASVSISSFIPWAQCPGVPQMKYLFPGEGRAMTVLVPVCPPLGDPTV
ncbi:unnamed protein product [Camellia sinensis]